MARDRWDLARAKAKREPKRRIIIYCEGENTEPAYFRAFARLYRDTLIKVEPIPAGVPMSVAESAVARARAEGLAKSSRKKPKSSFEEHDQIWAAFDVDEHPNFNEAVALCISEGVRVCRSNPCFEIWLILHETDFDRPDGHKAVCTHLRSLRPEYDPDGAKLCDFDEMIARVERAETRARKLLTRRQDQRTPFGRPSTTAGELTAAIREAAELHRPKR
ncbi:RloB domain-containing protein [Methylosinus sp. H3A]|uniref:RloB family protein n=1 Tax=Methylosinus sp. H3A TaxID=2785786 RepID=UPI0018C28840|nr:RloB family protein [Methylosinus sp. H3A]MBG0811843.1 RloB domain-containing protein [Methylosinus sp. H3A]